MFQYLPLTLQLCSPLETEAPDLKLIQILGPHIHPAPIRTPLHGVAASPILRMNFLETAPDHPEHLALSVHMVAVVHAQPLPEGDAELSSVGARRRVPAPTGTKGLGHAPTAGSSDEHACVQPFD